MVNAKSLASSRQVFVWSVPTVAIVLSILWYRRRVRRQQTDPGGTRHPDATKQQLEAAAAELLQQQKQKPIEHPAIPEEEEEDAEELRIVQQEQQRLLAEGLITLLAPQPEKDEQISRDSVVSEEEAVATEQGGEEAAKPQVISSECRLESPVAVKQQPLQQQTQDKVEAKTAVPKKGKRAGRTMAAPEQQPASEQTVGQLAEVMAKISVDVQQTQPQPRDSANNSPAEAMLASPTISHDSDTHSVGSSDSGKGGSDVTTPVLEEEGGDKGGKARARTGSRRTSTSSATASTSSEHLDAAASTTGVAGAEAEEASAAGASPNQVIVYEFVIPLHLVGRIIGKNGCFVSQIKAETHCKIQVTKHPDQQKFKLCTLEGTQAEVDKALKLIRRKFPQKKYPQLTLERVSSQLFHFPLIPESLQMYLVEGINNDVILSSLVSAGHMFLQQPTHPTFPVLSRLIMTMSQCYTEEETPTLPNPAPGVVCAAPSQEGWYRAEVIDVRTAAPEEDLPTEEVVCDIKFVDYGGYMTLPASALRQIRTDFMMLPFQATECYLADIIWLDGEEAWSVEATQCVEALTRDQVLQAQVVAYAENGVPYIRLFSAMQMPPVMVNDVLVQEGLAKYYTC